MLNSRQNLGRKGEDIAASYLTDKGYAVLARNYRCRYGEIDIIAQHRGVLVFIEVKTRTNTTYDCPAAAVTANKQRQICRSAQQYLVAGNLLDAPARFDVVSILLGPDGQPAIELITDAFDLC